MSRWYSHFHQTLLSMSCVMFSMVVLMHLTIPAVFLEMERCKHCLWLNPSCTISDLVTAWGCCLRPLHDKSIDMAGVNLGTPGPANATLEGPHLVGIWTPVPSHPVLQHAHHSCDIVFCEEEWTSANGTKHLHSGTVTIHLNPNMGILASHIQILCLLTFLDKWKVAFITKSDPFRQTLTTIDNITQDMLKRVWQECDICRATCGAHQIHLRSVWNCNYSSLKWWWYHVFLFCVDENMVLWNQPIICAHPVHRV